MSQSAIAVLGAGSWGTAVAMHLANAGHQVLLWGRDATHVQDMQATRYNQRYLPNIAFPENLNASSDLSACVKQSNHIIIAVPSHAFDDILLQLDKPKNGLCWITKGLDPSTNQFLSQRVFDKWGEEYPIAILSGPSFAREVALGLPTAVVLAGNNPKYQQAIKNKLHHGMLRVYESQDICGVQWCGAVKNIIAIACGISDGMNYGANAKAALITRGLAEMSRIGVALGGCPETFMGLAGVGDLVLTCTDDQSRNRRYGLYLGQGLSACEAEEKIGQVVEGKHNSSQVCTLAKERNIDMPICQQVHDLLQGNITPKEAVISLMTRPAKEE